MPWAQAKKKKKKKKKGKKKKKKRSYINGTEKFCPTEEISITL